MNMKIRSAVAVSVALIGLSASTAMYAASTSMPVPVHAMFSKTKTITVNLRNDSAVAMELKVGEDVLTIEAGKTVAVKVPVGTRITANAATPMHSAGDLVSQVSSELNGATLGIK
ncbi:hypothetical protein [Granulicella arctica]|uniref:hypothetical protein n=1 Tax=Granulicella arctica TaxID=940613 RepID=UPI0021DFA14F|nr:hypothetical protein [Granulicella arctica]